MKEREVSRLGDAESASEIRLIGQRRIILIKADGGWLIKACTGKDVVKLPLSPEAFGALATLMGAIDSEHIAEALTACERSVLIEEKLRT